MFRWLTLAACFLCHACGNFAISFKDYHKYSLPDRFNPIYGALLVESDFILKAFLYGNEERSFVSCVSGLFYISDPNSTSSSDLKTKGEIKINEVLDYLSVNSSEKTLFEDLEKCRENDLESVLLWAAFYLHKKRMILSSFKEINKKLQYLKLFDKAMHKMDLKQKNALIYIVENHRGTPLPQVQYNQFLHGANAISFYNCVESTTLDLLNFGIFSNPGLKENLKQLEFNPHWSKDRDFRMQFFNSINQLQLIDAKEEEVKEVYSNIFKELYSGQNVKKNWAMVNQDLPRLSYANFYIVKDKTRCRRMNATTQFVKVDQILYDSSVGAFEYLHHEKEECSQVKFKHLKNTNIYLTADEGIILFEVDAMLRNFEGIIRYFFGLDFNTFKINTSEEESFENLSKLFYDNFLFEIVSSSDSENKSTFHFKFNDNSCSGDFTVTKQVHANTSNFHCAANNELLSSYQALIKNGLPSKMKLAIEYFNLNSCKTFDVDEIKDNELKVFSSKVFNRIFNSSFIKMEKVFHYAEKSQHQFIAFFDAILKRSDKTHLMQSFMKNFVVKMNANEVNVVIDHIACKGELLLLKYIVENIPNVDPAYSKNAALILASSNGHLDLVEYLVSIHKDFPGIDPAADNNSSLIVAASNRHLHVVKYLISLVDIFPGILNNGNDAIISAAANGNLEIVKYLVSVNDSLPVSRGYNFAQRLASIFGFLGYVQKGFLKFDPAAVDNAALRLAAENGYLNVVQYLISIHKQYPNIDPAAGGNSAFEIAAFKGHLEIVQYLISVHEHFPKIDPATRNNFAFNQAALRGHLKVVKYLISIKKEFPQIDPTAGNNFAVIAAAERGHVEIVFCLVEYLKQQNIFTAEIRDAILYKNSSGAIRDYVYEIFYNS